MQSSSSPRATSAVGIACGVGAAVFWAAGFVAARHGITAGLRPPDIILHRFVWAGLIVLPIFLARGELGDLGGVGDSLAERELKERLDVAVISADCVP